MSDPITLARNARQHLAQGLAALQAPGIPEQLLSVAQPVAQAMGLLHQIESTQGASAAQNAPMALETVRQALAGLQASAPQHPAVGNAIAAVAGSLNLVHSLVQTVSGGGGGAGDAHAPTMPITPEQAAAARAEAARRAAEQQAAQAAQAQAEAARRAAEQQAAQAAQAAQYQAAQAAQYQAAQAAQYQAAQQAAAQAAQAQTAPAYAAAGAAGAPQAGNMVHVDAALGAHSTTNFYKGLSGNDVVDSGGIFVATYQIPDLGTQVLLHVSMPGGYEFEATGVVAWTREAPLSSIQGHQDAPPGFGARFVQITPEGRQLVYRYVRNREPLFHDDL